MNIIKKNKDASDEDKEYLNVYHSPSPMNELCDYIETWEKKNILWDNKIDLVDTRCLIIDNDLDLSDRKVRKICRKYINKYAAFIHDYYSDNNKVTSSSDVYRNEVNFSIIIDDFKEKILNELKMQENIIANYIISVSYSSVSISKSLAWSAYGDYIIENLKNNTNPKRNISIREVPYKTDDSYEYLGKYYEFEVGDTYLRL